MKAKIKRIGDWKVWILEFLKSGLQSLNFKALVRFYMESSSSNNTNDQQWRAEEAIGGNAEALEALRELITFPLYYSRESQKLGLKWHRGLLLYGPPGTGKTSLVRAIVRECGAHLIVISPHSVHRAHAGESERILREAFSEASSHAALGKPSVIFIDEIDALCPRRDSRREQDIRVASQLFTLMDSNKPSSTSVQQVVVVASTNRVEAIDPALRRSGRFDAEVEVTTPTDEERLQILKLYTKKLPLNPHVNLQAIAASCNGYVGADLEALCREATMSALRSSDGNEDAGVLCLTTEDWKLARSVVGPSITRGVTVEIPKVSWEDIGGLKDLKKKLQQAVEWPIKHSTAFSRLGISPIRGVLLHGPPGCSKTTLAKAAAHAAQASFFSLSGAELYSMYVGEGEALLRNTFQRARLAAPSIIFFDEADVVAAKRGGSSSSKITVGERLLSTLLTEMDGLEQAKGILVLAATNRPYAIDPALMRPGRFDLPEFDIRTRSSLQGIIGWWARMDTLQPYVKATIRRLGFGDFIDSLWVDTLDRQALMALFELWWDTTNTFHFEFGEMTMTPLDFTMITGLSIGGRPLDFYEDASKNSTYLDTFLGAGDIEIVKRSVRRNTLLTTFSNMPEGGDPDHIARAFLLYLFSCTLFAGTANLASLGLLASLEDIDTIPQYDWGGAALATMYRIMCCRSRGVCTDFGGMGFIWEVWAHEYLDLNNLILIANDFSWPTLARYAPDRRVNAIAHRHDYAYSHAFLA